MRREFARPFADLFRPLTAAERAELKASIEQHGVRYPVKTFLSDRYGHSVIDGGNRLDICDELGIDCPTEDLGELSHDTATELAEQLNHCRRHLSGEDWRRMAQARAERVKRVAEKRREGKSIRTIAEEEGVSAGQVQRDIEEATVSGDTVLPEDGQTISKDGVKRPASMPTTRPADEPELFAGEIRDGEDEPVNQGDSTSDGDPEQPARPHFTFSPKGKPPPPRPEYEGELDKVMKSLTAAATALTRFIRSDEQAAELFVHYCTTELKTGWVLYDWKKGQALDAGNGEYVPIGEGPVFTGLRMLRRLLHVSHKYRKLPPKKLREKLHRPGEVLPPLDIPEA